MNKKEKLMTINKNQRQYHIPGNSPLHPRKRNALFISASNSIKHELVKATVAYYIKQMGCTYISEAVRNTDGIRVDLVVLDFLEPLEIEIIHKHRDKRTLDRYDREGVIKVFTDESVREQLIKQGVIE